MSFDFVDLFAGVGGFHGALGAMGGTGVLASEIDPYAAEVYRANWGLKPEGDVVEIAAQAELLVPDHTVLAAGFPCQPFSKSGYQRGMSETRGQLIHEVLRILAIKRPPVVFLENVRNLAGNRQRDTWRAIVSQLREIGYRVPSEPAIFSPHLLPPELGGSPQIRERVYILGTYVGKKRALAETDIEPVVAAKPVAGWQPKSWNLREHLLQPGIENPQDYELLAHEREWIKVWNNFLLTVRPTRLPSFPMWSSYWHDLAVVDPDAPVWKQSLERKNIDFYREHRVAIRKWLTRNTQFRSFPPSRQKLEWQAGDGAVRDLRTCLIHFRPSGIRVKLPTYAPALVAMAQTPVYGPLSRRLTPREAARLQGFPDDFKFGDQSDVKSYKQMGNAIHIGAAYYALRLHAERDQHDIMQLERGPEFVEGALSSPRSPKTRLHHSA